MLRQSHSSEKIHSVKSFSLKQWYESWILFHTWCLSIIHTFISFRTIRNITCCQNREVHSSHSVLSRENRKGWSHTSLLWAVVVFLLSIMNVKSTIPRQINGHKFHRWYLDALGLALLLWQKCCMSVVDMMVWSLMDFTKTKLWLLLLYT